MKPEQRSKELLGVTRSKAKMYEFGVPEQDHIQIYNDPNQLFSLTIGMLGDLASTINDGMEMAEVFSAMKEQLRFSAHFFDAYLQSRLNQNVNQYLILLGASAYYLCDFPGSANVLIKYLNIVVLNLNCASLDKLIAWALLGDFEAPLSTDGRFTEIISSIESAVRGLFKSGENREHFQKLLTQLRLSAYQTGSPRELLFADVAIALLKTRYKNSTWHCLPQFTNLSLDIWSPLLQKKTFMTELWPAQRLLGERKIFAGKSAVVQMPTSAGKTQAIQLVIRSAFLANRTSLAVIIVPFRALCHEISAALESSFQGENVHVDELTDVLELDISFDDIFTAKQVFVMTPEKLYYILKHETDIGQRIGLIVYDEGHQFDSGVRGVTYELLLTSLKAMVSDSVQIILISAVIKNADQINDWLTQGHAQIVTGTGLNPTYRTVAFATWQYPLGQLSFVTADMPDIREYFVPKILEQRKLERRPREKKEYFFPDKKDSKSIAIYLGLKLVQNGSVAIFCGKKDTAIHMCELFSEAVARGLSHDNLVKEADETEVLKLYKLHSLNLGEASSATRCSKIGLFAHHGNMPQGIRAAIEFAMQEGTVKFVICTSTLAQGVNLPIRYLIVTSLYQGRDQIKVRDFHNLIGRAGRSGKHTEGIIIFADPTIYDERIFTDKWGRRHESWNWKIVKGLLNPDNSEPCASSLLSFFDPWQNWKEKKILLFDMEAFLNVYLQNQDRMADVAESIHRVSRFDLNDLLIQVDSKVHILEAVESYLMGHWDDNAIFADRAAELAKGTLAYHLADEVQKRQLIDLFTRLYLKIMIIVGDPIRRRAYSKTLYGTHRIIKIEHWLRDKITLLDNCSTPQELLIVLWAILDNNITNNLFKKCFPREMLLQFAQGWINGVSFESLFLILSDAGIRFGTGQRARKPTIEHVVEMCESGLSFHGSLILGAILEAGSVVGLKNQQTIDNLLLLQRMLKYGLPNLSAITFYELGFIDRCVALQIASAVSVSIRGKKHAKRILSQMQGQVFKLLEPLPRYFTSVFTKTLQ